MVKCVKTPIMGYDPKEGKGNERRLPGVQESASVRKFSGDVAGYGYSIRIPRTCGEAGRDEFENR